MSPGEDHSRPAGTVQRAPGLWRTDLQHELSVRGGEVVQQCAGIGPDATPAKHTCPGEQIICVLEGSLEHQIEGQPPPDMQRRGRPDRPGRSGSRGKARR